MKKELMNMVKIIKHGKLRSVICPYCECYFYYEPEDIYLFRDRIDMKIIDCPECNYVIQLGWTLEEFRD